MGFKMFDNSKAKSRDERLHIEDQVRLGLAAYTNKFVFGELGKRNCEKRSALVQSFIDADKFLTAKFAYAIELGKLDEFDNQIRSE